MSFTDQLGNQIFLEETPKRIISIVPSQTELLFDLGLRDEVVGITKFCIHPDEWFKTKTRVGGTKQLNIEKIKALQPDLIIGNKEENEKSQVEELMKHFPVWMSDIKDLNEALNMISSIGEITQTIDKSHEIIHTIKSQFLDLKSKILIPKSQILNCAYFIWNEPFMCAGKGTFIDSMITTCGLKNIVNEKDGRYPEITEEQLKQLKPDIIFLSSEPFPFKEKHIAKFKGICPNSTIKLVDGEMFSWYGSRLQLAPAYFQTILNSF